MRSTAAALVLALLVLVPVVSAAAPEGTLTWGVHVTLASRWLDPAETEALITPFMVLYAIHDALVKPMPAGQTTPSLAESWTVSKDGLTYEFTLRKNARFHNGDPVTAEDVKFSFDRYKGSGDVVYLLSGPVAEDVHDQRDAKSPWHDKRVRLAASHAIDRQALNQAETLGFSKPTGSIIPRIFEFALPIEPPAYDAARARKLLAEAGYPSGFDAGDFYPFPPYNSMGEALAGYLQAVGIRSRIKTMERASFLTAWREHKLRGVIVGITGASGNAATRLEAYVSKGGMYSYGVVPEIEDLFQRQAREMDRKSREALLHQIQKTLHERAMHAPVYELAFIWGVGPRVEEPGAELIKGFAYSGPYEDLKPRAR